MQFQLGEKVTATIPNMTVIDAMTDTDEMAWVTVRYEDSAVFIADMKLPIGKVITYRRETPADGIPEPGELWADQVGCLYVVQLSPTAGRTTKLIDVDRPHETAAGWEDVHRGTTGPIFRVAERPQVGA